MKQLKNTCDKFGFELYLEEHFVSVPLKERLTPEQKNVFDKIKTDYKLMIQYRLL